MRTAPPMMRGAATPMSAAAKPLNVSIVPQVAPVGEHEANTVTSQAVIDLDDADARRLAELEQVVDAGLDAFVAVAQALTEINVSKLYRQTHATFEGYIADRFGIGRAHAYRLMAAATVVKVVSPVGDITSERQARELVGLDPKVAQDVFVTAKSAAEHRGVPAPTGADLKAARTRLADREVINNLVSPTTEGDVTDEQFESALAEAKAEGNLSRANVVRKVKAEPAIGRETGGAPAGPAVRKRRPLPAAYRDTAEKALRDVQSLSRLHQDTRFTSNRSAVANHAHLLARAANELCDLLDDLGVNRHLYGGAR